MEAKKAVILMSGGLDSTTVLAIAKSKGFEIYALSFNYGQRHEVELAAVRRVIERSPVRMHKIVDLDLRTFGGSALTSSDISVPRSDDFHPFDGIPVTYVPARNTIFLSMALAFAETVGAFDIFVGVNAVDYSNYPDCRPEYIECFEKLANLATSAGVQGKSSFKIHAPLIELSKAQIIKTGLSLGVDYSLTTTCYSPNEKGFACGKCDACHLRLRGFEENGLKDPVAYQN